MTPAVARAAAIAAVLALVPPAAADAPVAAPPPAVDYVPLAEAGAVPGLGTVAPDQGAVLVPALLDDGDEPHWRVRGGDVKASAPAGEALALPAGRYEVSTGSGGRGQQTTFDVEVRAGELARVTPTWGALIIHTVDTDETPYRGPYLLFDLRTRDAYGFGRGAEEELGEKVRPWLLRPSIYKIVGPLDDLDAVINFATVRIGPGEVTHFVLVMDRETGDLRGSGVVPSGDFTVRGTLVGRRPAARPGAFKVTARVGGDFSQSASDNVLGLEGNSLGFGLFTDMSASYQRRKHLVSLSVDLAGGIRKNAHESFVRKVQDEVSVECLYIHQTEPRVGRYARVSATSQLTHSTLRFSVPTEVLIGDEDPLVISKLRISNAFDPLFLRESAGLNLRVLRSVVADLDTRTGLSLRQTVTRGFLVSRDDPSTDAIELERASRSSLVGGEVVVVGTLRLAQLAALHVESDVFIASEIRYLVEATLSIRLFKSLSVGVLGAVRRDELTNFRTGFSESFFVRASRRVF